MNIFEKIIARKNLRKEITVNTLIFMGINVLLSLYSAVSLILTNTAISEADLVMTPKTFTVYGFGNVALGEIVYLCIYLAMFAIPIAIGTIVYHKEQMNEYIAFGRPKFWLTLGGIFGVYAINYACYIFTAAGSLFFSSATVAAVSEKFTPLQSVILFVIIAVAPAFLEEFTFRGFILGRLEKYNKLAALLVSSLLFSFMHMTVEQIPFAFLAGMLMGYVYLRTRSIWSVIIIHGMNNLLAFIETMVLQNSADEEYTGAIFTVVFAGLFIIGFVSLLIMAFTHKKLDGEQLLSNGKGVVNSVFHPITVICILLCAFVAITYAGVFVR